MPTRLSVLILLAMCSSAVIAQQNANPAQPCYDSLASDARLAPIREKVSLGGNMDEMKRMTARIERPSEKEIAVIATWRSARDACHRLETDYYVKRDESIATLAQEHFAALQSMIAGLESGKLTYGEFGRRRLDLHEKTSRRIEEIRQGIRPPKIIPHPGGK